MTLDDYQQQAARTAARSLDAYAYPIRLAAAELTLAGRGDVAEEMLKTIDQLIWCLGLAGEVGETLDMLKKHWGHGKPLDLDALKKEFGDVRWYGANLERTFGFKSSDVAQTNVNKLRARYPAGFTVAAAAAKADAHPSVEQPWPPAGHGHTYVEHCPYCGSTTVHANNQECGM